MPVGTKVVLQLLSYASNPSDHTVFFDNFFTSYDLLVNLKKQGFKATGTLRENRAGRPPLASSKDIKKTKRSLRLSIRHGKFNTGCQVGR